MANPLGENDFNPEPVYGAIAQQQELAREAPISGAPVPGSGTTSKPAVSGGPAPLAPGPMALPVTMPPSGAEYYTRLATTWRALARTPGASEEVKAMARSARSQLKNQYALHAQGVQ